MKKENNKKVYLTFPTDNETAWLLKEIAHALGKTEPQLIEEICKNFISNALKYGQNLLDNQNK